MKVVPIFLLVYLEEATGFTMIIIFFFTFVLAFFGIKPLDQKLNPYPCFDRKWALAVTFERSFF